MMTVVCPPGRRVISVVSEPISRVSSSLTILMTIWAGFSPCMTSSPMARSSMDLVN